MASRGRNATRAVGRGPPWSGEAIALDPRTARWDPARTVEDTGCCISSVMALEASHGERQDLLRLATIDPGSAVRALKGRGVRRPAGQPLRRADLRPRGGRHRRGVMTTREEAMFTHILVPIDLGDQNARTLRTALDLAVSNHARVTLLHVVHRVAKIPYREMRVFYQRLVATSKRRLVRAAAQFVAEGIAVRSEVRIGEPAREILRVAVARGVDLVVMGSHTVNPALHTRGWGTTSYKVGIFCQCPILLVK